MSASDLDFVGIGVHPPVVSWLRYRPGSDFAILAAYQLCKFSSTAYSGRMSTGTPSKRSIAACISGATVP